MAKAIAKKKQFLEKDKRVKVEINRLKKIFKDLELDEKKMQVANSLIENAAFMTITLEDLQVAINENGVISEYKNGENQYGTKQSDEVKTYISLINRHSSVMKQLTDLLPAEKKQENINIIEQFAQRRPD
jgi:hypothetical protein